MLFLEYITLVLSNFYLIFSVALVSLLFKFGALCALIKKMRNKPKTIYPLLYLIFFILGNMFTDLAWTIKFLQLLFIPQIGYPFVLFIIRIAWAFFLVQYQAIGLFLESLVDNNYTVGIRQKILFAISGILSGFFIITAIVDFNCSDPSQRMFPFESIIQNITTFYSFACIMIPSLFIAINKLRLKTLPLILNKQLKILLQGLVAPIFIVDFIQLFPLKPYALTWITHSYAVVSISTVLITTAIYFCIHAIFGLRFLNLADKAPKPMNNHFINDFKLALEQLGRVTNFSELGHIVQNFFRDTFAVSVARTHFYVRDFDQEIKDRRGCLLQNNTATTIETFFATNAGFSEVVVKERKILMYDEEEFVNFYESSEASDTIIKFLQMIEADVFLPIYEKDRLVAYITIDRHSRQGNFYSKAEHDEFVVFTSYLGNIINLLQTKRLDLLIEQEHSLKKELYYKHQEINQYKESIRSFAKRGKTNQTGVLFYRNRHFTFGNQAARDLIPINLNTEQGHELSQTLKKLIQQVEQFNVSSCVVAKIDHDTTLSISAVPHLDSNMIIVTVSYPDIADILSNSLNVLENTTEWDYVLYLETTQSGRMVNKLIPSNSPTLLSFKISLLRAALSKRAILIDSSEDDKDSIVEIIHHVGLRETLHTLDLQKPTEGYDVAVSLFGINPLFGLKSAVQGPSLLERLHMVGTLFINNVEYLDMESQENLALLIRCGYYTLLKSDQKIFTDVRIVCSSSKNLADCVQAGTFSKALFNELHATKISMPPVSTLSDQELYSLAEGITLQSIAENDLKHLLLLTEKDKKVLSANRPLSLEELKARVQIMILKKSKKNMFYEESDNAETMTVTDPDLIAASRLGKQALKDKQMMVLLWNKFQQNQNKISAFLGVNRSSVNRRCKEYDLL